MQGFWKIGVASIYDRCKPDFIGLRVPVWAEAYQKRMPK